MGIAAALLMTQEDRTSARQEMYKAALYAAKVGLRNGEDILRNTPVNSASALLLYNPAATGTIREVWRDSTTDELPRHPPCGDARNWNAVNIGTYLVAAGRRGRWPTSVPIAVATESVPTGKMAFYLYVRNNRGPRGVRRRRRRQRPDRRLISVGGSRTSTARRWP
jgi:hypothetical protein